MLSDEEISKLRYLKDLIQINEANIANYNEYESLLLKAGLPEKMIREDLINHGYDNYKDFYKARQHPINSRESKIVNGIIAGALIGIAAAVIIKLMSKE
jgi:hypothetical protein